MEPSTSIAILKLAADAVNAVLGWLFKWRTTRTTAATQSPKRISNNPMSPPQSTVSALPVAIASRSQVSPQSTSPTSLSEAIPELSGLAWPEIRATIEGALPAHVGAVRESFKGVRVQWEGELVSIHDFGAGCEVEVGLEALPFASAHCQFPPGPPPGFLLACPKGVRLRLDGVINDVWTHAVYLRPLKLERC